MKPLAVDLFAPLFQAYIIRSLIDDKVYIGITSRDLRERWNEHLYESRRRRTRMTVASAIAKHGSDNFRMEALCSARSWSDICATEQALIAQYDCIAPAGYNLRSGGEGVYGHTRTEDAIERSAAKHRGRPCHPNTREAAIRTHKGKPKSAETRARMSAARKGEVRSPQVRAKISAAKTGISQNVGSANGGAKLSDDDVRSIKRQISVGARGTQRRLAREFGVSTTAIWKIANGGKWGHVI